MMADAPPRAYRVLYDRGTAALLVLASGIVLAASQTHVIRDWVAAGHPAWSPAWPWMTAIGFELVILAVGLVLALTGDRVLWAAELFLVGVSVLAAIDNGVAAGVPLHRAVLSAVMPLQYLAAVLAGHRLAGQGSAMPRPVDMAPHGAPLGAQNEARSARTGPKRQNGRAPVLRLSRPSAGALTMEVYRAVLDEHVPPGTTPGQSDVMVAGVLGVSAKTVQRFRLRHAV